MNTLFLWNLEGQNRMGEYFFKSSVRMMQGVCDLWNLGDGMASDNLGTNSPGGIGDEWKGLCAGAGVAERAGRRRNRRNMMLKNIYEEKKLLKIR